MLTGGMTERSVPIRQLARQLRVWESAWRYRLRRLREARLAGHSR
jgi:DNA-binding Lrp family transcriptional regulator